MKTKSERLKTVRDVLKNLKKRRVDGRHELVVLDSAIYFYEAMESEIKKERSR